VVLEDALGQTFRPLPARVPDRLGYSRTELAPGECLPDPDSSAEQTFDGAAVVFEVPIESTRERPMILEIRGRGLRPHARVQLDL
jgi:hypothetical protein